MDFLGEKVVHNVFGEGVVTSVDEKSGYTYLLVKFDSKEIKMLYPQSFEKAAKFKEKEINKDVKANLQKAKKEKKIKLEETENQLRPKADSSARKNFYELIDFLNTRYVVEQRYDYGVSPKPGKIDESCYAVKSLKNDRIGYAYFRNGPEKSYVSFEPDGSLIDGFDIDYSLFDEIVNRQTWPTKKFIFSSFNMVKEQIAEMCDFIDEFFK